jgi:hypothetical protein
MIVIVAISLIGAGVLVVAPTGAQDGDSERQLSPNTPVTGNLDTENFAESFIFAASEENTISLTATTSAEDLSLAMILTDPNGDIFASDGDLSTPQSASIPNLTLETDGTYVVTVLRGTGADGDAEGEYTLTLTGDITPPSDDSSDAPTTIRDGDNVYIVLENGGIDISLQWSAAVDFNLEVRDPVGGALYFENLGADSGGEHSGDVNDVCDNATSDNPTETISWPEGSVPVGSYEIIIYYEQSCSVGGPQSFVLTTSVDGEDAQVINGVLNPDQNHLARLVVNIDREWSVFNGGVSPTNLDLTPVASPQVATIGQSMTGTLTNEKPKDGYTFEATAGQTVSIDMAATSGSLDTLVILLGPDGRLVASNDDRTDGGTTDSGMQVILTTDGVYTIIASRYGQSVGGTEGNYTMFVDIGSSSTVANDGSTTTDDTTTVTTELPAGSIQVTLQWFTNADLQLQVRDPSGATVFDDEATIASGGILDQTRVGNRGCEPAATTPTTYIYWPTTRIPPTGTYEVEVWFQDDCDDPTPVSFSLSVVVNGQTLKFDDSQATTSTATASTQGNRYMLNFTIDATNTATLGEGGFFSMDVNNIAAGLDFESQLGTATPLEYGDTVQGRIDQNQKFVVYTFEGRVGDRISVQMTRIGLSSLDTAVYIIGPGNIPLAGSDDIAPGENTNSLTDDIDLLQDGTYYIIATHYGLRYGATAGDFTLSLDQFP